MRGLLSHQRCTHFAAVATAVERCPAMVGGISAE
jgi:hypothetical protein